MRGPWGPWLGQLRVKGGSRSLMTRLEGEVIGQVTEA